MDLLRFEVKTKVDTFGKEQWQLLPVYTELKF